jgi:hypothetical protein
VKEHNREAAKGYIDLGFTVITGSRYLVACFIGEGPNQKAWIQEKTANWVTAIHELSWVAEKYQQVAYAGLQKSLQQEWQFLQQVTKDLNEKFWRNFET